MLLGFPKGENLVKRERVDDRVMKLNYICEKKQ